MRRLHVTIGVLILLLGLISNVALATPIPVTDVTASSYFDVDRPPQNTINGSGLSGTFPNQTHDVNFATMWMTTNKDVANAWIQFDLGAAYNLASAHIWNYNQNQSTPPSYMNRGVQQVDIFVSTVDNPGDLASGNWVPLFQDTIFLRADGTATYAGFTLDFGNIQARYVRFEIDSNYSLDPYGNYVGLSEIQFNAVPEPATMLLLGTGLIGVGVYARRKFKK